MPIDRSQATYLQYRARARDLYERCAVTHGEKFGTNIIHESISVPEHAVVHICDEGAFVEALVWVPKSNLHRPEQRPEPRQPAAIEPMDVRFGSDDWLELK